MAVLTGCLLDLLPIELVERIILFVDHNSPPPSTFLLHEPPSVCVFEKTSKPSDWVGLSLKSVSETCWGLRYLVAPRLFTHLKVGGEDAEKLVRFRRSNGLHTPPKSILWYIDPLQHLALEVDDTDIDRLRPIRISTTWMVDLVNPQVLTILAPPKCLGWLIDHPLRMSGCWVTNAPYQTMRLEQGSLAPAQWFPTDKVHDNRTLSTVRPWNHCTYNEGSFVPAYSTYEFYNYAAPSLHQSESLPELQCHALQLGCLQSFELVAVFPFNHITNSIYFLDHLPNLQRLSVRLAPTLECQKSEVIGTSASAPSDFWLELESNYYLLRNALNHALTHLSVYNMLDYASPGYRNIIDLAMADISADWKPNHKGTWTRKTRPPTVNTVSTRSKGTVCPNIEHSL